MRQAPVSGKVHQPFPQGVQPPVPAQPSARQDRRRASRQARPRLHVLPSFRAHPKSLKTLKLWLPALSFALAAVCLTWPILDFDVWWHLANGHDILSNLSIPRTENFSHTFSGFPWIDFEWLFQVIAALCERWGGLRAVTVFKSVLIASGLLITAWNIRLQDGSEELALLGFWSSFLLVRSRAHERPEIVTIFFLPLVLYLILKARESGRAKPLWGLPLLMAVWVNCHAGFILGLGAFFLAILGKFLREKAKGYDSGFMKSWGLCFLACVLATGLNPYGFHIYRILLFHVGEAARMAGLVEEWKTLGINQLPLFWVFLLVSVGFLMRDILRKEAEGYFWLPLLLAFGYWASGHVRSPGLFPLVAAPYIFGRWAALPGRFFDWTRRLALPASLLIMLSLAWGLRKRDFSEPVNWFFFPRGAADFLERNQIEGVMYNTYEFGGYLEWRFGHKRPVFFDGRYIFTPVLQQEAVVAWDAKAFGEWLSRYRVTYVLIKHAQRLVDHDDQGRPLGIPRSPYALYFPRKEWALVYWDDTALVYLRRIPKYRAVISKYEYKMPDPDDADLIVEGLKRGFFKKRDLVSELERHTRETGDTLTGKMLLERIKPL